jgi:uncharacterized protein
MNVQIPLFPLGTVLFPGGVLPLQIFEVRYLDMVRRCHREGTPFGVVCLTQGHEVQQAEARTGGFKPEGFHDVGTLAHIVALEQARPGLLVMVCEGRERFQIQRSEKLKHGLWMADVDLLPEDSLIPLPPEQQGMARALHGLRQRLEAQQPGAFGQLPDFNSGQAPWNDAGWVANRWAELLPMAAELKQRLLTLDSPLLRLDLVGDALEQLGIEV